MQAIPVVPVLLLTPVLGPSVVTSVVVSVPDEELMLDEATDVVIEADVAAVLLCSVDDEVVASVDCEDELDITVLARLVTTVLVCSVDDDVVGNDD